MVKRMPSINFRTQLEIIKKGHPLTFAYSASSESRDKHVLHINQFYEIYVFVRGDTDYIVGNSYYHLKHGDIIIINPYEVHKAVLKSSALYERFYMLVPTDIFNSFSYNPMTDIMSDTERERNLISMPDKERKRALDLLYQMYEVLKTEHSTQNQLLAYGLFLQFISLLSDSPFEASVSHTGDLPPLVCDVLKYINTNLTEIDSIDSIAAHFGISAPYLSTIFKSSIGTTAIKYIQTRKIAYAKILLDQGLSVTDACYQSGFNDCAYFIKLFKEHIGMTPLHYKKNTSQ